MCGFTGASAKIRYWRNQAGLDVMDEQLSVDYSTKSSRTFSSTIYGSYVSFVVGWWERLWLEQSTLKYRKLRFHVFQKQQQAVAKIAYQLTLGKPDECIVLWGDGSFGPTLSGHAPAPNVGLRRGLAVHRVHILLCCEYGSSKNTCCCHMSSVFAHQSQQQSSPKIKAINSFTIQSNDARDEQAYRNNKQNLRGLLYCKHQPDPSVLSVEQSNHQSNHRISTNPIFNHVTARHQNGLFQASENDLTSNQTHRHATPWNRDMSAAINIMNITYMNAYSAVPRCFKRGG